jgi:hypothetical protein
LGARISELAGVGAQMGDRQRVRDLSSSATRSSFVPISDIMST